VRSHFCPPATTLLRVLAISLFTVAIDPGEFNGGLGTIHRRNSLEVTSSVPRSWKQLLS